MDNYTTLQSLHERGVHFVLCRAADDGPRKVKSAIAARWQTKAPTLEDVLKHHASNGLLGFIPGRSSIWALDIDTFPAEGKDTGELLASVSALATISTPRGRHIYFKKASSTPITNRAWALGGYSGDIRSDNGYVICWEIEKVLEALDKLPGASPTSTTLFPKPPKAKLAAKGFVKGHRTATLNARVYGEEMRGETDHSAVSKEAIESGLPPEKVAKANKKTIADAQAAKARTSDAPISEHVIALGFTEQYRDTMRYCPELGRWFEWDTTRWRPDRLQRAFHYVRSLASENGKAKGTRKASFARGVESFCRAAPEHAVEASYWDADPWLLGTPGGTVDLKTGRVLEAAPSAPDNQADGSRAVRWRVPALAAVPGRMHRERCSASRFFTALVWVLSGGQRPRTRVDLSLRRGHERQKRFPERAVWHSGRLLCGGQHGRFNRVEI